MTIETFQMLALLKVYISIILEYTFSIATNMQTSVLKNEAEVPKLQFL